MLKLYCYQPKCDKKKLQALPGSGGIDFLHFPAECYCRFVGILKKSQALS